MISKDKFNNIPKYVFPDGLRDAVRVAETLQMPLLLTGKPGTGKTKAAEAIVEVLKKEYNKEVSCREFNTKSTSVGRDLLYTYNHLSHFLDVQLKKEKPVEQYIDYNALGQAIKEDANKHSLVLIDEIDKAPRDFPNDLLDVIDKMQMEVPELNLKGEKAVKYKGEKKPFVLMTSNSEKSLPDAFLRRCVYYNIPFPKAEMLENILLEHIDNQQVIRENYEKIESFFAKVSQNMNRKPPATAEFINWLDFIVQKSDFAQEIIENLDYDKLNELNDEHKDILKMSFSILAKNEEDYRNIIGKL